jgi:hypothetical protein
MTTTDYTYLQDLGDTQRVQKSVDEETLAQNLVLVCNCAAVRLQLTPSMLMLDKIAINDNIVLCHQRWEKDRFI